MASYLRPMAQGWRNAFADAWRIVRWPFAALRAALEELGAIRTPSSSEATEGRMRDA